MTYDRFLDVAGNWAAILTAAVAALAYGAYRWERYKKRRRLEEHLKSEKGTGHDGGQRSVVHLVRHLKMTESEVFDAAFRSKVVQGRTGQDGQGLATVLLFEYDDGKPEPVRRGKARF